MSNAVRILVYSQALSLVGSAITRFSISIWVFQETNTVLSFSLVLLCSTLPGILASPLAGVVIDRRSRKQALIASDLLGLISTAAIVAILASSALRDHFMLMLCAALSIASIAESIQWPAWQASISSMTEEPQLVEVNGIVEIARSAAHIMPPIVAGFLFPIVAMQGMVWIDILTYLVSIACLFSITIPTLASDAGHDKQAIISSVAEGLSWWKGHLPLLALALLFVELNFFMGLCLVVFPPYLMSLFSETWFGMIQGMIGCGFLFGGVVLNRLSNRRPGLTTLHFGALAFGILLFLEGLIRSPIIMMICFFLGGALISIINGIGRSIFQARFPDVLQGRLFANLNMAYSFALVCAYVLAAPLVRFGLTPLIGSTIGRFTSLWGDGDILTYGILVSVIGLLFSSSTVVAIFVHRKTRR